MSLNRRWSVRGFTLIELLIVIAIIGIIASILIPNLLESLQKSRQKRTMAAMREIGQGVAQYWSDNNGAAAAGAASVNISLWSGTATVNDLSDVLVPDYMPGFTPDDGWGREFEFRVHLNSPPRSGFALTRSGGRHGTYEGVTYIPGTFIPSDYDQDLVWADGSFLRAPASTVGS